MEYLLENEDNVVSAPRKSNTYKRVFKDPKLSIISSVTDDDIENSQDFNTRPSNAQNGLSSATEQVTCKPNSQHPYDPQVMLGQTPHYVRYPEMNPAFSDSVNQELKRPHIQPQTRNHYSNSQSSHHHPRPCQPNYLNQFHNERSFDIDHGYLNSGCLNTCCAPGLLRCNDYSRDFRLNGFGNGYVSNEATMGSNRQMSDHRSNGFSNGYIAKKASNERLSDPILNGFSNGYTANNTKKRSNGQLNEKKSNDYTSSQEHFIASGSTVAENNNVTDTKYTNQSPDVLQVIMQQLRNQDERLNSMQQQMLQMSHSSHSNPMLPDISDDNVFYGSNNMTVMMILRQLQVQSNQMQKLQEQMSTLLMNVSSDDSSSPIASEKRLKHTKSRKSIEGTKNPSLFQTSPSPSLKPHKLTADVTKASTSTMTSMIFESREQRVTHQEVVVVTADVSKQQNGNAETFKDKYITPDRDSQKQSKQKRQSSSSGKSRRSHRSEESGGKEDGLRLKGNDGGALNSETDNICERKGKGTSPSCTVYNSPKDDMKMLVSNKKRHPLLDAKQKNKRIIDKVIPEISSATSDESYTSPKQIDSNGPSHKIRTKKLSTRTPPSSEKRVDSTYQSTKPKQIDTDSDDTDASSVYSSPTPQKCNVASTLFTGSCDQYLERYGLKSKIGGDYQN